MIQTSLSKVKLICKVILLIVLLMCFSSCSPCDYDKPDTKANLKGFKRYFDITPDNRVSGVFFYADELGVDASYWFAFSAPQEVIDKIVKNLNLMPTAYIKDDGWHQAVEGFPWWNYEERKKSNLYEFRNNNQEIVRQLWYNPETKKCQVAIIYW